MVNRSSIWTALSAPTVRSSETRRIVLTRKGHGFPHDPLGRDHYLPVLTNEAKDSLGAAGLGVRPLKTESTDKKFMRQTFVESRPFR